MKPTTIKVLRQGLRQVVTDGTGKRLSVPTIPPAASKSGTAEAGSGRPNHTWFGAYAPLINRKLWLSRLVKTLVSMVVAFANRWCYKS